MIQNGNPPDATDKVRVGEKTPYEMKANKKHKLPKGVFKM